MCRYDLVPKEILYWNQFQINAILRKSYQFSKLQHIKFWALTVGPAVKEVDQEVLAAARKVIPNIVIEWKLESIGSEWKSSGQDKDNGIDI